MTSKIIDMEIKCHFDHYNINVANLERSLEFYKKALNLHKSGEIVDKEGNFIINYLSAPTGDFRLELTWMRDHPQEYELGENETHLALRLDTDNYEEVYRYHKKLGCVCYENPAMGIYFIHDPDDYWIEILRCGKRK